jgi:hypothetical protein
MMKTMMMMVNIYDDVESLLVNYFWMTTPLVMAMDGVKLLMPNDKMMTLIMIMTSVADPDPGSGAFLSLGSGIRNRIFPDTGSQTHIFESLVRIFWVKSSIIPRKFTQIFPSAFQK